VLGWASSPEPTEPSLFKPKSSPAPMRACNGLGLGFRYGKSEPRAQARALIHCSLACRSAMGKVKYYSVFKNRFNKMTIKWGVARTSSNSSVSLQFTFTHSPLRLGRLQCCSLRFRSNSTMTCSSPQLPPPIIEA